MRYPVRRSPRRGAVLIVVLGVLAILSLPATTFATPRITERQVALYQRARKEIARNHPPRSIAVKHPPFFLIVEEWARALRSPCAEVMAVTNPHSSVHLSSLRGDITAASGQAFTVSGFPVPASPA